jgi:hypothetical protein
MRLIASVPFLMLPIAAVAHDGSHFHPHGIEYGWIIAAAIGLGVGYVLARIRK